MEQTRLLAAITLSFLVIFLWQYLYVQPEMMPPPEPSPTTDASPTAGGVPASPAIPEKTAPVLPAAATVLPAKHRDIKVDTPFFTARISEIGGAVTSLVLKEYRESAAPDSPLKEIIHPAAGHGTALSVFSTDAAIFPKAAFFSAGDAPDALNVSEGVQTLTLTHTTATGIRLEKRFAFSADSYLIRLDLSAVNQTGSPVSGRFAVSLSNPVSENAGRFGFEGPSALINNHLEQIDADDIKDKDTYTGRIGWTAVEDQYFIRALVPRDKAEARMNLKLIEDNRLENRYFSPEVAIAPGKSASASFDLFFGPKYLKLLKSFDDGLDQVVNFGFFDFLAKPCLWLMNLIYGIIPNYGVAIIILTLIIKIALWPLGNKSYQSMNQMKKLQPLMAEIREKYKNNKTKMHEETMNLYRTYKVNPMGGCLPMALQIPVFFALYRMLYQAIELRHAPFFGWITDLSAPDRLFDFGTPIPFMHPPYGIPVLTIIMGATMFLQQKMSPPPGDPAQARIMMFMPVMFTFIFINFSSGLVLYWLVNNILSIGQQYYIGKKST
ncbi:MAG: membrane protein insertase YidC [Desulfobacterales bacterium]|nr:MAG: membrane protein insertase YidC [Desulfobacterales bacterium]